jgi:hypothetical protein
MEALRLASFGVVPPIYEPAYFYNFPIGLPIFMLFDQPSAFKKKTLEREEIQSCYFLNL